MVLLLFHFNPQPFHDADVPLISQEVLPDPPRCQWLFIQGVKETILFTPPVPGRVLTETRLSLPIYDLHF